MTITFINQGFKLVYVRAQSSSSSIFFSFFPFPSFWYVFDYHTLVLYVSDGKLDIVIPSFVHYLDVLEGSDGDKMPGMACVSLCYGFNFPA